MVWALTNPPLVLVVLKSTPFKNTTYNVLIRASIIYLNFCLFWKHYPKYLSFKRCIRNLFNMFKSTFMMNLHRFMVSFFWFFWLCFLWFPVAFPKCELSILVVFIMSRIFSQLYRTLLYILQNCVKNIFHCFINKTADFFCVN